MIDLWIYRHICNIELWWPVFEFVGICGTLIEVKTLFRALLKCNLHVILSLDIHDWTFSYCDLCFLFANLSMCSNLFHKAEYHMWTNVHYLNSYQILCGSFEFLPDPMWLFFLFVKYTAYSHLISFLYFERMLSICTQAC